MASPPLPSSSKLVVGEPEQIQPGLSEFRAKMPSNWSPSLPPRAIKRSHDLTGQTFDFLPARRKTGEKGSKRSGRVCGTTPNARATTLG